VNASEAASLPSYPWADAYNVRVNVRCPKCNDPVGAEDLNVSTDLARCRRCGDFFKLSEAVEEEAEGFDPDRPPGGVRFEQGLDGFRISATTRHPIAFFLVPFMAVWSGGSLGGIYGSQIASGKFNLLMSLFGIPFVLGTILLGSMALMAVGGRVAVKVEGEEGQVFTGFLGVGLRRRFDWSGVKAIREKISHASRNRTSSIVLEGEKRISFGSGLNEGRRWFLLHALRAMLRARRVVAGSGR
jgi:hypothetical protein